MNKINTAIQQDQGQIYTSPCYRLVTINIFLELFYPICDEQVGIMSATIVSV
jgi:hypothetical protein